MIVACLALIVALGGTAIAGGVLNKKKVNKIINNRAPGLSVASAKNADNAANAKNLGGQAPSAYQGFCKAGAIKGTLVINTNGFTSTTFQNVPGFNCFQPGNTGTSVQLKEQAPGIYVVRFVGNTGPDASGSAVCSSAGEGVDAGCFSLTGGPDAPGETVFRVNTYNTTNNAPLDNQAFSLLAF
jgi:hypothetical protein